MSVLPIDHSDAEVPDGAVVRLVADVHRNVVGRVDRHSLVPAIHSSDELLIAILALFNESTDLDVTLGMTLTMLTAALDGRIGEIWLRDGAARDVELQYSSSDGAPDVAAFEAERPRAGSRHGTGAGQPRRQDRSRFGGRIRSSPEAKGAAPRRPQPRTSTAP